MEVIDFQIQGCLQDCASGKTCKKVSVQKLSVSDVELQSNNEQESWQYCFYWAELDF